MVLFNTRGWHAPTPLQRRKATGSRKVNLACFVPGFVSQVGATMLHQVAGQGGSPSASLPPAPSLALPPSRRVCWVTRQTCLLRATKQTRLLCRAASRHVRCATLQTCPLCHALDMFVYCKCMSDRGRQSFLSALFLSYGLLKVLLETPLPR